MSIYINKCDLFNELGKIAAPIEANDFKADIYMCIDQEDGIDAVDITYCKDCIECHEHGGHANCNGWLTCGILNRAVEEYDFCSWGRRA